MSLHPPWRWPPPKLLTSMSPSTLQSPVIVRSGASTWMTANNFVWQLGGDGSLNKPLPSALPASDMVANAPWPRLVGATKAVSSYTCSSNPGCSAVSGPFRGYCYPYRSATQRASTWPRDAIHDRVVIG